MRGKASSSISSFMTTGITPAYAGKSTRTATASVLRRDHPRLCGEKINWLLVRLQNPGSPPPMRGKVVVLSGVKIAIRITPAYAGKRLQLRPADRAVQDHPRLCGEKKVIFSGAAGQPGSPPPMRGKGLIGIGCRSVKGIPPAYAGKSFWKSCFYTNLVGSPPPMRGKVHF